MLTGLATSVRESVSKSELLTCKPPHCSRSLSNYFKVRIASKAAISTHYREPRNMGEMP
jgi:hypothetical protein